MKYSVVIPVYNEEESLNELCQRLHAVLGALDRDYEIIFIDDGSRDNSYAILESQHSRDKRAKVIRFSRNFGHHLAITAGIDLCRGEVVILMDADLQDLPEEIPLLLEKIDEGYDVAYAVKDSASGSLFKRLTSRAFIGLLNRIAKSDVSLNSSIFRAMTKKVAQALKGCRERSRFITGLVSWLGFSQVPVKVARGQRIYGSTKYSFFKMIKLALNSITSFSYFPLQCAMYFGFFASLLSFGLMAYMLFRKIVFGMPVSGYASIISCVLFIGGVQLVMLGVIGEYIGRIYSETQGRPLYIIDKVLE